MEAANALDGNDAAPGEDFTCPCDSGAASLVSIDQIDFGAAVVAADRLRIIAARFRMRVFPLAGRAHGELAHARALPVIGHGIKNGEARPAGSAVDEGVEIAAVLGVEKFPLAFFASGDIRRDKNLALFLFALDDIETCKIFIRIRHFRIQLQYSGTDGRAVQDFFPKSAQRAFISLREDFHVRPLVGHRSENAHTVRQPAHKRTEPDSLHDTVYLEIPKRHDMLSLPYISHASIFYSPCFFPSSVLSRIGF